MTDRLTNWAGNCTFDATSVRYPTSVEEVQELVSSGTKLKALGSRHSFNDVANTGGQIISLERFAHTAAFDAARRTVTVDGGKTYGQLALQLQQAGYALRNMASLPHITIAGACATTTHGSGDGNGCLATAVAALDVVTANGELVTFRRDEDGDAFDGAVVALGGLGVVTRITLDIEPSYEMRQDVYVDLPLAQVERHFDAIEASAYSVSLFTNWCDDTVDQVWLKSRITGDGASEPPPDVFGAKPAQARLHPIEGHPADITTEQQGIPGPWYARLPHFRMGTTPSSGDELQTEYLIPRQHAIPALRAVFGLAELVAPYLQVSEVRVIAADAFWMSPFYRQDCVGIHFTWTKDLAGVLHVLSQIDAALAPFEARPHWGKLFTTPASRVQSFYPKLPDFRRLLQTYDPSGKFRNAFLDAYVFGG